ncbi:MAG: riboflavin synthase [Alphaproteobacteria bacterium]|nr:riboflavin synthase [Alphaproteobacteria bacterium]
MFTGIITDKGRVRAISKPGDTLIEIDTSYDVARIAIGASIACSGPCLTVVRRGVTEGQGWFAVEASAETLSKTTIGDWSVGTPVNLERALRVGDELGGHIVSGHVDGVGTVRSIRPEGQSWRFSFEAPSELMRYIAHKGSIAIDGVSLTVNEVEGETFGVNIIPHTFTETTFGQMTQGQRINLEIDALARYVERIRTAN